MHSESAQSTIILQDPFGFCRGRTGKLRGNAMAITASVPLDPPFPSGYDTDFNLLSWLVINPGIEKMTPAIPQFTNTSIRE